MFQYIEAQLLFSLFSEFRLGPIENHFTYCQCTMPYHSTRLYIRAVTTDACQKNIRDCAGESANTFFGAVGDRKFEVATVEKLCS